MSPILSAIALIFAIVGILCAYAGRKRRVGIEPHCRKCNYLLHGLPQGLPGDRCPECGSTLSPAAIVLGEPHRKWRPFFAGWIILIAVALFFLAIATDQIQDIDWYQHKPTYFVLRDMNSKVPADELRAWTELIRRDGYGSLSPGTRDQMVRFALAVQGAAKQPFSALDANTVNYLGARVLTNGLSASQSALFFQQGMRTSLAVRPKVIAGDWVPYRIAYTGLGPNNSTFWSRLSGIGVQVDHDKNREPMGGSSSCSGFSTGSFGTSAEPLRDPGKHQLSVTVHIEVFSGSMTLPGASKRVYQTNQLLTGPFEVVPKQPTNFPQAVFDPKLASTMAAAVTATGFSYDAKNRELNGSINFSSPPANGAYDVVARFADKDHSLSYVTWHAGSGNGSYEIFGSITDPVPPKVIIILRPSEKAAANTVDIFTFWDQTMTFPDVPVAKQ